MYYVNKKLRRRAPLGALGAPLLRDLVDWDLGRVGPLLAQRADRHQRAQQGVTHARAPRGLQVVHQGEATLADGGVDGVREDDGDDQEDVVEGVG